MKKITAAFFAVALFAAHTINAQPQTGPFPTPGGGSGTNTTINIYGNTNAAAATLFKSALEQVYLGNGSFQRITNWAYAQTNGLVGVNTSLGTITNLSAGLYSLSADATLTNYTGIASGYYAGIQILTNGVSFNTYRVVSPTAQNITYHVALTPAITYLPSNCVITVAAMFYTDGSAPFGVLQATLTMLPVSGGTGPQGATGPAGSGTSYNFSTNFSVTGTTNVDVVSTPFATRAAVATSIDDTIILRQTNFVITYNKLILHAYGCGTAAYNGAFPWDSVNQCFTNGGLCYGYSYADGVYESGPVPFSSLSVNSNTFPTWVQGLPGDIIANLQEQQWLDIGGTGTNPPTTYFTTNSIATNIIATLNFTQVPSNCPVVTVGALGLLDGTSLIPNGGCMFGEDTIGTTTHGVQEAVNAFLSIPRPMTNGGGGGFLHGIVQFSPGVFRLTNTVTINTDDILLVGSGNQNTYLKGLMTNNADIVDINGSDWYCGVRDLTFTATANDQKTYLNFSFCSGIDVENCTFQPWSRIQADSLVALVRLAKNDSIGIKTFASGMKVIIRENMFAALDCSLFANCQDVIFEDNYVYGFIGTNDWPATSVFYTGAQIVINPGIYGSGEGFNSMNNLFVTGTHPAYAVINPSSITNFCSYNDRFESIYFGALVEGGTTWTFINPTEGGTQISQSLGLIAYNTTNWTSWSAPSNYISSGSVRLHNGMLGYDSGNFKYGGTVTASNYVGSGSGLTFTNGNGARFKIGVNTTTNGLTFIPQ